jgi:hypothetical protein
MPAVEHFDDAGVTDRAGRARLAHEALRGDARARDVRMHQLHRDAALRERVQRLVHRAHAAAAEQPLEVVLAGKHLPDP